MTDSRERPPVASLPRSRREFLKLSALLTGAAAWPAVARSAGGDEPVRIGYLPITDASPLLVAHAREMFQAEGLEVAPPVLLRSWAQLVEAFMAGRVNVVHLLSPMTVWGRYGSRFPMKVVAWNHMAGSALTVAPDITTLEGLGGRRVAVPFWYSIHNVVLQHLLRKAGLEGVTRRVRSLQPHQVGLTVMAPADMGPALVNGSIAGFIVAEPFNAAAETQGIGKVLRFTGDVWRDHACCVVAMHAADLDARPAWSQGVVSAIVKAQHWLRDHRGEAAQLLSNDGPGRYTPFPVEVLERVLVPDAAREARYIKRGAIRHPDWRQARIDYQPYPFPSYTRTLVQMLQDTAIEGNNRFLTSLDPDFVARDLVDDRFVRLAIAQLGGLGAFGLDEQFERSETIVI